MGLIDKILGGSIGKVVESIGGVADRFITTGDDKRKFNLEVAALIQARDSEIEQTLRTELDAKARIIEAEMSSGDNYTRRARPTVVYFGLVVIFINYTLIPVIAQFGGNVPTALDLPTEFWAAWGGIVATWVIGRTAEKRGNGNKMTKLITGGKGVDLGL